MGLHWKEMKLKLQKTSYGGRTLRPVGRRWKINIWDADKVRLFEDTMTNIFYIFEYHSIPDRVIVSSFEVRSKKLLMFHTINRFLYEDIRDKKTKMILTPKEIWRKCCEENA